MPTRREYAVGLPADEAELRAAASINAQAFLASPEQMERWIGRVPPDQVRVARTRGGIAGLLRIIPWGQWFGGRRVPMGGVASVAVLPEHRSAGVAGRLVRAALEEMHTAGLPVSVLFPATQPVYRRAGYEQAGAHVRYRLPVRGIDIRDRTIDVRPADKSDRDLLREIYTERARRTSGNLDRDDGMWGRILEGDGAPVHAYIAGREGYVVFTQHRGDRAWRYEMRARDLVALTPAAGRRLLTLIVDHRSQAEDVVFSGAPADPLLLLLGEQEWRAEMSIGWMLRVVDVRGALAARGYAPGVEAEVHLEVRDDVLPWNDGRFVLEVSSGTGKVRKGGRGRVRVDVRGLAAMYTGRLSPAELLATAYLEGPARDLAAAAAVFAGPTPWMADFY